MYTDIDWVKGIYILTNRAADARYSLRSLWPSPYKTESSPANRLSRFKSFSTQHSFNEV